jgi:hypothetical protein
MIARYIKALRWAQGELSVSTLRTGQYIDGTLLVLCVLFVAADFWTMDLSGWTAWHATFAALFAWRVIDTERAIARKGEQP